MARRAGGRHARRPRDDALPPSRKALMRKRFGTIHGGLASAQASRLLVGPVRNIW
jgi:hypothetical protein